MESCLGEVTIPPPIALPSLLGLVPTRTGMQDTRGGVAMKGKTIKRRRFRECRFEYDNWVIDAGRVRHSLHPANRVYLILKDRPKGMTYDYDLTDDEAAIIIHALSHALHRSLHYQRFPGSRVRNRR